MDIEKSRRRNRKPNKLYKRVTNAVLHCNIYSTAVGRSDHLAVVCKLRVRLQKLKRAKAESKFQYDKLLNDVNVKEN